MYRKLHIEIGLTVLAMVGLLFVFTVMFNPKALGHLDGYLPAVLAFLIGLLIKGFWDLRKKRKRKRSNQHAAS